jgi:GNAT superfamily N-acetyltransferase
VTGPSVRELLPPETRLAFAAMRELRPDLRDQDEFVRRIDDLQRPEGYRLVGRFANSCRDAVAVAGFRVGHSLAWGRFLYVDDLCTLPASRRQGHARALLDWLLDEAGRLCCDQLHLDSAVGPQRADAHRLYLNARMVIAGHHFARLVAGAHDDA